MSKFQNPYSYRCTEINTNEPSVHATPTPNYKNQARGTLTDSSHLEVHGPMVVIGEPILRWLEAHGVDGGSVTFLVYVAGESGILAGIEATCVGVAAARREGKEDESGWCSSHEDSALNENVSPQRLVVCLMERGTSSTRNSACKKVNELFPSKWK